MGQLDPPPSEKTTFKKPSLIRVKPSLYYRVCEDMVNRAGSRSSNKHGFINVGIILKRNMTFTKL